MEHRPFEVAEDLDGAEELIQVVGQTSFGVAFLGVRENFYLGLIALGFRGQSCVHGHVAVSHEVAHGRHDENSNQQASVVSQLAVAIGQRAAYRVVKFMVKVKLIENKVKSHVGSVMVVKVIIQYSAPGSTVRMLSITRASRPNVEEDAGISAAGVVCRASATAATVWGKLAATELEAAMASAAAVDMVVDGGGE